MTSVLIILNIKTKGPEALPYVSWFYKLGMCPSALKMNTRLYLAQQLQQHFKKMLYIL